MMDPENTSHVEENPDAVTDEHLSGIISDEINNALGHDDDEIEGNREDALDYYLGRKPGDPGEGNSKVLSMDVADMVEATLSQILPQFAQKDLVRFPPDGADDEQSAQLESDAVNFVFMQLANGQHVLRTSIKDGLLQRNGIVKTVWKQIEKVRTEVYEGVTQFELPEVLNKEGERAEILEQEQYEDVRTDEYGNQVIVPLFNLKVLYTRLEEGIDCMPVPPEEFLINTDHHSIYMEDARFLAHRKTQESESGLIAQGYDKKQIEGLPTYHGDADESSLSRNRSDEEDWAYNQVKATRSIEVYEVYLLVDRDGDGIAERRRIMFSNTEILKYKDGSLADEPYEGVPFASGSPFLMPHRWLGVSMYDKQRQIQDTKTALLRQAIDNGYANNNQRIEVLEGKVNMEDVSVSRAWGPIRVTQMGSVNPLPVQNIGQSSLMLLDYMDKVRRERGGASLDMGAEAMPTGNMGDHGVERIMTSMELLSGMMAKSFSDTMVTEIFRQIHRLLRRHSKEPISLQKSGQWVQVNASQWPERKRINVNIGMSTGERGRRQLALDKTLNYQIQAIESGNDGILTDLDKVHNTLTDIGRAAGMDDPAIYWIDPESPEAQQALQSKQQQEEQDSQEMKGLQQQLAQAQNQLAQAEMVKATSKAENDFLKLQLEQAKALGDAVEKDAGLEFDYTKLAADVAIELTKLEATASTQLNAELEENQETAEEITEAGESEDETEDETP